MISDGKDVAENSMKVVSSLYYDFGQFHTLTIQHTNILDSKPIGNATNFQEVRWKTSFWACLWPFYANFAQKFLKKVEN